MFNSVLDIGISKTLFLIDEVRDIDKTSFDFDIIEVKSILPEIHQKLIERYNPFEVCCALKPVLGLYQLKNKDYEHLIYADTDLCFYSSLSVVFEELGNKDFLLTPHCYESPKDYEKISELDINATGLYNGGFYVLKDSENSKSILEWWSSKTINKGYNDVAKGMFVDQIWLNYLPIYFNNIIVSKNKSVNMAYWNLHERLLSIDNGFNCNGNKLVMYHFSGFRLSRPDLVSIHQTRYSFSNLPELTALFKAYFLIWSNSKNLKYNDYGYTYSRESKFSKIKKGIKKKIIKQFRNENSF